MPQIIKKEGAEKTSYYIYDYIYDVKKGKFIKKYVGQTNKNLYKKYKKEIALKQVRDYCQVCGKRREETLPEYYDKVQFDLCGCERG